jgi:hypothetical protein
MIISFVLAISMAFTSFFNGPNYGYPHPKEPMLLRENKMQFHIKKNLLERQDVQFYMVLLGKDLKPLSQMKDDHFPFEEVVKEMDLHQYWEKRGNEKYYVLLTKVSYLIDKDVHFYNEQRLSDVNYIRQTLPEYQIEKLNSRQFKINCGSFAPTFSYDLDFYRQPVCPVKNPKEKKLIDYTHSHHKELGAPALSVIQHNYHFGRVMLHKTSKMSVSIYNYYATEQQKTLVVNYTLNYIYELPPNILGGHELLIKEIANGIRQLIMRTREVSSKES